MAIPPVGTADSTTPTRDAGAAYVEGIGPKVQKPEVTQFLADALSDDELNNAEWKQVQAYVAAGDISKVDQEYLELSRSIDPDLKSKLSNSAKSSIIAELKKADTVLSRNALSSLNSGKEKLVINLNRQAYDRAHLGYPNWDPRTNSIVLDYSISADGKHQDLSSDHIKLVASDIARFLADDVNDRTVLNSPESLKLLPDGAEKILSASDIGKAVLADFKSGKLINIGVETSENPLTPKEKELLNSHYDDQSRPFITAGYNTGYSKKNKASYVLGFAETSPTSTAKSWLYAYELRRTAGDYKKADELYQQDITKIFEPQSDAELLADAFKLLEQTPTGKVIADRLKRDNVEIELKDKPVKVLGGEAGGFYNALDKKIQIHRADYMDKYTIASTLAHEGVHYIDFENRDLKQRLADDVIAGARSFVAAPFQGKNPLAAAINGGYDKALETERNAFATESKVAEEIGTGEAISRNEANKDYIYAKGSVYQIPDFIRYPSEMALGAGATAVAAFGQRMLFNKMGWKSLGWKPTLVGLGATAAFTAHDYLNRKLTGDEREAFNVGRVGLAATGAVAGANMVSKAAFGKNLLGPFKLRYALGAVAVGVGIDLLKNKIFD